MLAEPTSAESFTGPFTQANVLRLSHRVGQRFRRDRRHSQSCPVRAQRHMPAEIVWMIYAIQPSPLRLPDSETLQSRQGCRCLANELWDADDQFRLYARLPAPFWVASPCAGSTTDQQIALLEGNWYDAAEPGRRFCSVWVTAISSLGSVRIGAPTVQEGQRFGFAFPSRRPTRADRVGAARLFRCTICNRRTATPSL